MTPTPNNEPNDPRRDPSQWLALDAGELRQVLANEMASWLLCGFFSVHRVNRLHRFAERLAAPAGMKVDQVYRDLRADGRAILAERGQQPHYVFRA